MTNIPPIPQSIKIQNIQNAGKTPQGYELIKGNVSNKITEIAKNLLKKDYGFELYYPVDNKKYFFRVEPHYDSKKLWHRGVTVYEPIINQPITSQDRIDTLNQLMNELMK